MTTADGKKDDRAAIEELLPWHAAGTLSADEARAVEAMIARDPELAHRLELAREELGETVALNQSLGAPSTHALDKLMAGIDALEARKPARTLLRGFGIGWKNFLAGLTPRTLAWGTMAAALLIIAQGAIITGSLIERRTNGGFETASSRGENVAGRAVALVRFAPQATAADITAFLDRNQASIMAGPMAGGLYRVRLPVAATEREKVTALIAALQKGGPVIFAVPADAAP